MPEDRDRENIDGSTLQNRGSISSFLFISFILFMLANSGGDDFIVKNQYRNSLLSFQYQQSNFSAWWHDSPSNFSLPETNTNEITFVESVMTFGNPLNADYASYYDNITGFIHGPTKFYNLSSLLGSPGNETDVPWADSAIKFMAGTNLTEALERMGSWNWTGCDSIAMRVLDTKPMSPLQSSGNLTSLDDISLIRGRFELKDAATGYEMRFDVEGVHFISNGSLYGVGETVGRHVDVRLLPSIVPPQYLNVTAQAVDVELLSRIDRLQNMIDSGTMEIDLSADEAPLSHCPFTLYAQIVPTELSLTEMNILEAELNNPTGIKIPDRPDLKLNGVLLSKECGILYEFNEAQGLKSQRFWRKVTTYAGTATVVYLLLIFLMVRQTDISRTPARITRLSRWSFMSQAAADAIFFVGHVSFGVLSEGRPSLALIAPAFLACVLMVYEAQFAVLIHQIQAPEDSAPVPTVSQTAQETISGMRPDATTPLSTPSPSTPASHPWFFWRLFDRIRQNPQARVVLTTVFGFAIFVRILISPFLALIVTGSVYTMFWMPQIIRAARRDSAGLLRIEYVLGTTLCRAFFVLYLFACPTNVLGLDTSHGIYFLAGLVIIQAVTVIMQDYFGPAFFLPKDYITVEKYDYHPSMPVPDSEAPERSLGDCAICMDAIIVHPDHGRRSLSEKSAKVEMDGRHGASSVFDALKGGFEAAGRGAAGLRKTWAVAPCHHIFHTACLEQWLAIKNICPQCRRPLPPL